MYSFDLHANKLGLIDRAAEKLGITIIKTGVQDATKARENMPAADKIICDVPCSGLGVIAKKPDIRYKSPDDVKNLPALQLEILKTNAAIRTKTFSARNRRTKVKFRRGMNLRKSFTRFRPDRWSVPAGGAAAGSSRITRKFGPEIRSRTRSLSRI